MSVERDDSKREKEKQPSTKELLATRRRNAPKA